MSKDKPIMLTSSDTIWDFLKEFFVPITASAVAGVVGYAAAMKKHNAEAKKFLAEADAIALNSVTAHFDTLINGYKKRIDDLSAEVVQLRQEVKDLRKALDARPR